MKSNKNNIAYIDGNNLYKGTMDLGWKLDYKKFRKWLSEKLDIQKAYIFMGRIPENIELYKSLEKSGFMLIFKEITKDTNLIKGNCDAELILKVACDTYENQFDQAIIVTSDGDFTCLIHFLQKRNKIKRLISPDQKKCSLLLRRSNVDITFLNDLKHKLQK